MIKNTPASQTSPLFPWIQSFLSFVLFVLSSNEGYLSAYIFVSYSCVCIFLYHIHVCVYFCIIFMCVYIFVSCSCVCVFVSCSCVCIFLSHIHVCVCFCIIFMCVYIFVSYSCVCIFLYHIHVCVCFCLIFMCVYIFVSCLIGGMFKPSLKRSLNDGFKCSGLLLETDREPFFILNEFHGRSSKCMKKFTRNSPGCVSTVNFNVSEKNDLKK